MGRLAPAARCERIADEYFMVSSMAYQSITDLRGNVMFDRITPHHSTAVRARGFRRGD